MGIYVFTILLLLFVLFIPLILLFMVAAIIIGVIDTKAIKSKKVKVLIVVVILLCIGIISMNIKEEKPDDLYLEMKEIEDEERLIGLSEEEVIILLGKPQEKDIEENNITYTYDAGTIGKGLFLFKKAIFFDCYYAYDLEVFFDGSGKVTSTVMRCIP